MITTLNGKITISRVHGNIDNDSEVRIELIDDSAICCAVQIRMPLPSFAEALMGLGYQDCVFDFNDSGNVGTVGQYKEELVPVPQTKNYGDKSWIPLALAPFEVAGWSARGTGDMTNHHRFVRDKSGACFQRVSFFRNVKKDKDTK